MVIYSTLLSFLKTVLTIQGLLWFHTNVWIIHSGFCEKCYWYFDRDFIKCVDCFGYTDILIIFVLPIHEWGISLYFFVLSSVSSVSVLYNFQSTDLSSLWLSFFLSILLFLVQLNQMYFLNC